MKLRPLPTTTAMRAMKWGAVVLLLTGTLLWLRSLPNVLLYCDGNGLLVGLMHGCFRYEYVPNGGGVPGWDDRQFWGLALDPAWRFTPQRDYVRIPLWPFPLLLTIVGMRRCLGLRSHPQGACPSCGYDLVGLASGAACPECGATVERHRVPT